MWGGDLSLTLYLCFGRGVSQSYSNQRDKTMAKLTKLAVNHRRFDGRAPDSPAPLSNQGIITQLSEQISTLNERMDEFTSRIEVLNSKFSVRKVSASQQNLAMQAETCNGSGPTSLFVTGLSNGSLTGSLLPNSSSSSQLAKESPLMEECGGKNTYTLGEINEIRNEWAAKLLERMSHS
ncbi:inorganic pyrophosphatase TTM2-like [Humulus lupulus]|uniref:inorganic pyrophosphatase TTM2-like n=1 Tax=Humulus lupulus TaxID=3486 RepID=UPI002B40F2ED|nr:inorganic pyrophosphatase TTM2-like [Humulus lupulus]